MTMVRSFERECRAPGRPEGPQPYGPKPRHRWRRRARQLARQAVASALCTAGFLAGQLLFGDEPAVPKIWTEYLRPVGEVATSRLPEATAPLPRSKWPADDHAPRGVPQAPLHTTGPATPQAVVNRTPPGGGQPQVIHNHTIPSAGPRETFEGRAFIPQDGRQVVVNPTLAPPAQASQPRMIENHFVRQPVRPQMIENPTLPRASRWPTAEREVPPLKPLGMQQLTPPEPEALPEAELQPPAAPEPARLVEATPLPVNAAQPKLAPVPTAAPPRLEPAPSLAPVPGPLKKPQSIALPKAKQSTLPPVVPASAVPKRPARLLGVAAWITRPRPIAAVSDEASPRPASPAQPSAESVPATWIQDIQETLDRDGTDAAGSPASPPAGAEPGVRTLRRHGQAAQSPIRRVQYLHVDDGDLFAAEESQPAPLPPRAAARQPATLDARELEPLPPASPLPPGSPFEAVTESGSVTIRVRRSLLMRTKLDIYRTAVVDETVCDVVQFTPREVSLIGKSQGATHVTFWFAGDDQPPLTYLVKVEPDADAIKQDEVKYQLLEDLINEMFPDSKVRLVVLADKLLVKGQARDSEEAAQILAIIRTQGQPSPPGGTTPPGGLVLGVADAAATAVVPFSASGTQGQPTYQIVNMLRVPGIQQVALRVKIAELNRSAARGFGVNVETNIEFGDAVNGSRLLLASLLNTPAAGGASVIADISGDDASIGIRYLQQRGVIRLLSEPTLVTLSGRPATFVAGGEFAVPTVVGAVGLNAVTTDFRAFGAIISFLPTVVDKDRIRLQVAPEFSQINNQLTVNNTPGLNVRAATTTVEMREGQTLAIAGLLEDNYTATTIGDLPLLAKVFGRRNATRNETELIILVTPELVHPLEPEEVPPLPGFDVTEPTNKEFFLGGQLEGHPSREYRSTVWPRLKKRYGGPAMMSGPFGHGE